LKEGDGSGGNPHDGSVVRRLDGGGKVSWQRMRSNVNFNFNPKPTEDIFRKYNYWESS